MAAPALSFRATADAPLSHISPWAAPELQANPISTPAPEEEEALAKELCTEFSAGSGSLTPTLRLLIKEQQEVAYDVISAELRSSGNWRDAPWAQLAPRPASCPGCLPEVAH
ncbi:hypothetical protein ABPG77_001588 [Micractinium sp. CCAP 211/92]